MIPLEGILPALTTPFVNGELSVDALRRNIALYDGLGTGGYLILGSTGEAVLLDADERRRTLEAARASIPESKPLVAGVAAESTRRAALQARVAGACGATAVLVSTPHYFRAQMTAEALAAHFEAVADESPVPVLLYNVPKFTGLSIPPQVAARLGEHDNVAGMKESSGDFDYLRQVLGAVPSGFRVLCGDVALLGRALQSGAAGGVLAAATVFPEPLIRVAERGQGADELLRQVGSAAELVVGRHGIAGIKAAMDVRGLFGGAVRSPLQCVSASVAREIEHVVAGCVDRQVLPQPKLTMKP